jgi:hypothetical protein
MTDLALNPLDATGLGLELAVWYNVVRLKANIKELPEPLFAG